MTSRAWRQAAALAALLALGWLLWQPGLTGGFLFDDFPNLSGLEKISAEPTLYKAVQYVGGGISSQIGRPLSLATFAAQHASWPNDPAAFVRVNILLHLLNALLLFCWLDRWSRVAGGAIAGARVLPLAVTALWLLTPLHTAAVLYVVQRMALLAGTCVLAGMLLHTLGREAVAAGARTRGYGLMAAALVVGLGLGTLAKESAALFPLLVLAYEATLLRGLPRPPQWRAWAAVTLVFPVAVLAAYLAWKGAGIAAAYDIRHFTLVERLLTEPRVLFLYLWKLFVPSPYGMRLLYDDLPISRSWLDPWTTVPALVAWAALVAAAIRGRRRWPAFSFGVLWYLGAHLLESSIIPLEIAFEHRNYHAAVGPLVALVAAAATLFHAPALRRIQRIVPVGAALYAGLVATCLWQASTFWGDRNGRTYHWAVRQPDSQRAMYDFASMLFEHGRVAEGERLYRLAMERWPTDATLPFKLAGYGCVFREVTVPSFGDLRLAIERAPAATPTFIAALDQLVVALESGLCPRFDAADLRGVYAAALTAPRLQISRQHVSVLNARLAEVAGDLAAARRLLDEAIRLGPNLALLTHGVERALQHNDVATAREYLALTGRLSRVQQWTHRLEIAGLHQLVRLYDEVTRAQELDDAAARPDRQ